MLVDTSVWIEHLRSQNGRLAEALEAGEVETHAFVIGELACGPLRGREQLLHLLGQLPMLGSATHTEALHFVQSRELAGTGLGWVDVHLLCAALLEGTGLWSLDRRLATQARELGLGV